MFDADRIERGRAREAARCPHNEVEELAPGTSPTVAEPPSSETRIEVAPLTPAERYARWRAKQIKEDPDGFRKREKDRISRIRAGPKSDE